jgi:hypothetical protein
MPRPEEDNVKLAELILYISQKCATDPKFGAVKLNKILFFSDFFAYARYHSSITGCVYQRLRNGPAPRRLVPVRDQMIEVGDLAIQPVKLRSGKVQLRTVNLRAPDLQMFTGVEIAMVDHVIDALTSCDAQTVSDMSHSMVGWLIAREGEEIPYETVFLSNEPLTEAETARGLEIAAKLQRFAA